MKGALAVNFEDFPRWVSKKDPNDVLIIRVDHDKSVEVQFIGPSRQGFETLAVKRLLNRYEPTPTPGPTRDYRAQPFWQLKANDTKIVKVVGLGSWQTLQCRRYDGTLFGVIEWEFLRDYEPSGPWPDKETVWGKLWATE